MLDIETLKDNALQFRIKLSKLLFDDQSEPDTFVGRFTAFGRQRQEFQVTLDQGVELKEGLPIGQLSLGIQEGFEDSDHTLNLMIVNKISYNLLYDNIIILISCVRAYEREVTGSHLTRAKKFIFLGIAGLGRYNRQPTDTASNGPSHD